VLALHLVEFEWRYEAKAPRFRNRYEIFNSVQQQRFREDYSSPMVSGHGCMACSGTN
jgi:hypothetical protein